MIIAQITDFHIGASDESAESLRLVLECLHAMDPLPDVILATGDLVNRGSAKEYAQVRSILSAATMPLFAVPGNHDDRERFREAFADDGYVPAKGSIAYVVDRFPVRLLGLDTVYPGEIGGKLDDDERVWLDRQLAQEPTRPTLIFMHHPPFTTGIKVMDGYGFEGKEAFEETAFRHSQVKRVICGHLHRPVQAEWGGTLAYSAPSTAWQFALDLRGNRALAKTQEPPGFALHVWTGKSMVAHTRMIQP